MLITKEKKGDIMKDLEKIFQKAKSVVFVNFDKLNVFDANNLRRKLQASQIGYKVARKTLLKRVLDAQKREGVMPLLEKEIAFAYGEDLIAPAREIYDFEKSHKENLKIVGGIFDGKYMNQDEMLSIATIPPMKVLYGQFVNLINSPIAGLVMALDGIVKKK